MKKKNSSKSADLLTNRRVLTDCNQIQIWLSSQLKMTLPLRSSNSPQDSCNDLLKSLRASNLHFIISETPYSVQICIRKKFINDAPVQKKSVLSSSSSAKIILEKKVENLAYENASLKGSLLEANENVCNLKNSNVILHTRIENAENKMFEYFNEKKETIKKLEDETALLQNSESQLGNACDTIARLEAEVTTLKTSNYKIKAAKKKTDVTEYLANKTMKDANDNLLNTQPQHSEPEQVINVPCSPSVKMSPLRKCSPTGAPPSTPPSPHTPSGSPPGSLSCYFSESVPDFVDASKPNIPLNVIPRDDKVPQQYPTLTEEYVQNLSKLNLAPRIRRQEGT